MSGTVISRHGKASALVLTSDTFNCDRLVVVTWSVPEIHNTGMIASRATVYSYYVAQGREIHKFARESLLVMC